MAALKNALCRRRRCFFIVLVDMVVLTAVFMLLIHWVGHQNPRRGSFVDHNQFLIPTNTPRVTVAPVPSLRQHCTMGTCFDFSRCRGPQGFKVYIYPSEQNARISPLFERVLNVIRNSPYLTSNPEEACLFVPSVDTLDRDKHSKEFVDHLPPLESLPFWNDGRNHLLFVQFSGTWPDYAQQLDFSTSQAILARASFNVNVLRRGFDISIPLMHKEHPGRSEKHSGVLSSKFLPVKRKYLLVFKGKRYLYGEGSRIRSSLHHLHNQGDIVMLTTCKHNQDWLKYTDNRCDLDNALYDRYNYEDLMNNSSFCLIPRGRRLGSFRFLEALKASCIPVSLSNGYVLPFSEVLDWKKASLVIDERQLFQLPYLLRRMPSSKVLSLRWHAQFMWDTYFSSVEKIITTTLEVIRSRVETQPIYMWNRPPGHLQMHSQFGAYPLDYPEAAIGPLSHEIAAGAAVQKFTAVITVTRPALRESSPVLKLVQALARSRHLGDVLLLWTGAGIPQVITHKLPVSVTVVKLEIGQHHTKSLWPIPHINTSAILHLTEDSQINGEEVIYCDQHVQELVICPEIVRCPTVTESTGTHWHPLAEFSEMADFGFLAWQAFPSRLVGFYGHTHFWDNTRLQWSASIQLSNQISMVTMDALFYHKYYGYIIANFLPPKVQNLADESVACLSVVLNFVVTQLTLFPPLKLPQRNSSTRADLASSLSRDGVACLNMAVNVFGEMSLLHSNVRLDPVLYRDNVSVYRKHYPKMEIMRS